MNRYVIYTIMTGGYDDILQPMVIDARFDYVLFSNDFQETHIGVWQVRPIPAVIDLNDNKRLSRYPKSHPETLLAEYDFSLYIDANIQVVDQWVYDRFLELAEKDIEIAGVRLLLTGRDCIYDHAYDMWLYRNENDDKAIRQLRALYKKGFPTHYGLNENNIIFRKHSYKMRLVDEEWWRWITNYSFRDQFSYMYCIWKYNIPMTYFLPIGEDSRTSNHVRLIPHDEKNINRKRVKSTFLEEKRRKYCYDNECNNKKYLKLWIYLYRCPFYQINLLIIGVYCCLWDYYRRFVNKLKRTL